MQKAGIKVMVVCVFGAVHVPGIMYCTRYIPTRYLHRSTGRYVPFLASIAAPPPIVPSPNPFSPSAHSPLFLPSTPQGGRDRESVWSAGVVILSWCQVCSPLPVFAAGHMQVPKRSSGHTTTPRHHHALGPSENDEKISSPGPGQHGNDATTRDETLTRL